MNRNFIIGIAFIALMTILVAGCNREPGASDVTPVNSSASSPISIPVNSAVDDTSEVLQSGIPLKVTEPADAAEIKTDTLAVKGQTVPGATVSVNGEVGTADSEGNFSITIDLETGPNAIDVIAINDSGKQGEVLILVNVVL